MPSLADLLRGNDDDEDRKPRVSHAGQIASLREFLSAYKAPISFKVGDLVTPKRSSCIRDAGEPHLVLETLNDASFVFDGEPGTNGFGKRLNVRCASFTSDGRVAAYWMEHHDLEPYRSSGSHAERADAEAA